LGRGSILIRRGEEGKGGGISHVWMPNDPSGCAKANFAKRRGVGMGNEDDSVLSNAI